MKILHLFSGYNTITTVASEYNIEVISLDLKNYKNCPNSTIICDFLDFDYTIFSQDTFNFVLVGFPCTTFSKASGGFHFKNNIQVTSAAYNSLKMIDKLKDLLDYFSCDWLIENPTSALFKNKYFLSKFDIKKLNLIRFHQYNYGHVTFKQTDLLTTKNTLWLDNPVHRVNGRNVCPKFDSLSLKHRQSYPIPFCHKLLNYIQCN